MKGRTQFHWDLLLSVAIKLRAERRRGIWAGWCWEGRAASCGGSTLGRYLSYDGMDTVDIGVAILAMHTTLGLASKIDLWWLYQYFLASYAAE